MARIKQPSSLQGLNSLVLDDGRAFNTDDNDGMGAYLIGREQHRLRQGQERAREQQDTAVRPGAIGPLGRQYSGGRLIGGPLPSAASNAYYGILQAKENASGGRMKLKANSVDVPFTTAWEEGQIPVDPNAVNHPALAGLNGAVGPDEDGYWNSSQRSLGKVKGSAQSKLKVKGQRGGPAEM
jgi:hypothetical protein